MPGTTQCVRCKTTNLRKNKKHQKPKLITNSSKTHDGHMGHMVIMVIFYSLMLHQVGSKSPGLVESAWPWWGRLNWGIWSHDNPRFLLTPIFLQMKWRSLWYVVGFRSALETTLRKLLLDEFCRLPGCYQFSQLVHCRIPSVWTSSSHFFILEFANYVYKFISWHKWIFMVNHCDATTREKMLTPKKYEYYEYVLYNSFPFQFHPISE